MVEERAIVADSTRSQLTHSLTSAATSGRQSQDKTAAAHLVSSYLQTAPQPRSLSLPSALLSFLRRDTTSPPTHPVAAPHTSPRIRASSSIPGARSACSASVLTPCLPLARFPPLRLHLALLPLNPPSTSALALPLVHLFINLRLLFARVPLLLVTGYDWAAIAGGHSLAREVPTPPLRSRLPRRLAASLSSSPSPPTPSHRR